jgi:hypothetical protein
LPGWLLLLVLVVNSLVTMPTIDLGWLISILVLRRRQQQQQPPSSSTTGRHCQTPVAT